MKLAPKERYALLALIATVIIVVGVWYAARVRLQEDNSVVTSLTSDTVISEIRFGALASTEEAKKPNPRITQKSSYATNEPLVMRITTTLGVEEDFQIGVRLVTQAGAIVELNPPSATFQPGTSSFCCWQVPKEGAYTLQIFRPEKTISTIPLIIQKAIDTNTTKTNLKLF